MSSSAHSLWSNLKRYTLDNSKTLCWYCHAIHVIPALLSNGQPKEQSKRYTQKKHHETITVGAKCWFICDAQRCCQFHTAFRDITCCRTIGGGPHIVRQKAPLILLALLAKGRKHVLRIICKVYYAYSNQRRRMFGVQVIIIVSTVNTIPHR